MVRYFVNASGSITLRSSNNFGLDNFFACVVLELEKISVKYFL